MTTGSSTTPEPSVASDHASEADTDLVDPPVLVLLDVPADGVPDVVVDERELAGAARAIAAGSGPVAIDAERASGYRYGQRAYLIQLRREGSGTWLVDPIACPDLSPISDVIADVEWILHAATQDLPCLAEVGLHPTRLFDTELAGRLIGLPRVGLGAVVEHYLGLHLAKEHSAVDWSTRPLPEPWLRYAALDVEVLGQVRDLMAADLAGQDKMPWAEQEFDALTRFTGPPVRVEPWRRTSGMHKVRNRRGAAMVRELWQTRDAIAIERDAAPGRVLPDAALIDLAIKGPRSGADIKDGPGARSVRRYQRRWLSALDRARLLPETDLPVLTPHSDGPPPARAWADRDPVAAARLAQARAVLGQFAKTRNIPIENVLSPDTIRRVLWCPPPDSTLQSISAALLALGARQWQVDIASPILEEAINRPAETTTEIAVEVTAEVTGE
ncbi:MAG TPA: HRDC domain-containing protein [Dermatophilaceae bacterium]